MNKLNQILPVLGQKPFINRTSVPWDPASWEFRSANLSIRSSSDPYCSDDGVGRNWRS